MTFKTGMTMEYYFSERGSKIWGKKNVLLLGFMRVTPDHFSFI